MSTQNTFHSSQVDNIQRIEREAYRLRGEAIGEAVAVVAHAVVQLFAPLTRVGHRVATAVARQRQANRIYTELSRLSDRDLADIGVGRSDIMAIANGTFDQTAGSTAPLVTLRGTARKVEAPAPQMVALDVPVQVSQQASEPVQQDATSEEFDRAA